MPGWHGRISTAADRGQDGRVAGAFTDWDGREWGGETEHHLVLHLQLRHSQRITGNSARVSAQADPHVPDREWLSQVGVPGG